MKLFSVSFIGHYPVGTAAVVVAENDQHAYELACQMLKDEQLWEANIDWKLSSHFSITDLTEIDLTTPAAHMLNNGNY